MSTTKQNVLILSVAVLIATAILCIGSYRRQDLFTSLSFPLKKGWGYEIRMNDRLLIRQETIPVIPQVKPFDTKDQAEQVAQLVIQKLQQHQLPTLTKFEIEQVYPESNIK